MTDESQIVDLLELILESGCTAEEACAGTPQLLPLIQARLRKLRSVENQVEALFPSSEPSVADISGFHWRSLEDSLPRIDGYEIEQVLGHGGMGVVYRAVHLKLKRTVALKMLLSGVYASPQELARFLREAEAVAGLQHPNIVQVHDVGELDGRPYFTMEYIAGGSLAQELAGTPQACQRSASLVAAIANAVEFAHQHCIVHRDLKPSNILLTAGGTPKVSDFGLARRLEDQAGLTQTGSPLGTPSYMAPEQARGKPSDVGPSVDIYSLGAILYELTTGRPPFRAETSAETLLQVLAHDPVSPSQLNPKVPRDLETICLKCLNKQPEHRYVSAAAMADDLIRFTQGQPIVARPVGWIGKAWRWCRRNPIAAAQAAIAIALAGIALAGGVWLEGQRADQRAKTALLEGRRWDAVETSLEKATGLQGQGRWLEARATLDGAEGLLSGSTPINLRLRLRQASSAVNMVAELDEIRLRLSDGTTDPKSSPLSPEKLYEAAFTNYGIPLLDLEPAVAAQRIRDSSIHQILVAFLHDSLFWVSDVHREKVRTVLDKADDDVWRREFRQAMMTRDSGKLKSLADAEQAVNQPPVIISGFGGILLSMPNRNDALALLRNCQRRHPEDFWVNYLLGLFWSSDRPREAVSYLRAAVALRPSSDQAYVMLGRSLRDAGDVDEAIDAFRKAIALNANHPVAKDLARALAPRGGWEEARAAWEKLLRKNPDDHEAWYGYAQLCLFLGQEEKYHQACGDLWLRYKDRSENWLIDERTSLACLLGPESDEDVKHAVDLANRAFNTSSQADNPYLRFLKGFAEYRQGHSDNAIPLLSEAADQLPNRAGPRLVLAMAQSQAGMTTESLKTLSTAVRTSNWNTAQATHTTVWVSHVLRREAESKILPNLPAFLEGNYQPQSNDERLALLGICQSNGLYAATSGLYADAFAADPDLADELTADCIRRATRQNEQNLNDRIEALNTAGRYLAARHAALAGCGKGTDVAQSTLSQRENWRKLARQWLRSDLDAWSNQLASDLRLNQDLARTMLTNWQVEPDFAGLRDPDKLKELPSDEQSECVDLWNEVAERLCQHGRIK